jgi:hypothetical protein
VARRAVSGSRRRGSQLAGEPPQWRSRHRRPRAASGCAVPGQPPADFGTKIIEAVAHELPPLDEAALAHRRMDAGEVSGRIVLTP